VNYEDLVLVAPSRGSSPGAPVAPRRGSPSSSLSALVSNAILLTDASSTPAESPRRLQSVVQLFSYCCSKHVQEDVRHLDARILDVKVCNTHGLAFVVTDCTHESSTENAVIAGPADEGYWLAQALDSEGIQGQIVLQSPLAFPPEEKGTARKPCPCNRPKDLRSVKKSILHVGGICCGSEVPLVKEALNHSAVYSVHVDILQRHVTIEHSETHGIADLVAALKAYGFTATEVQKPQGRHTGLETGYKTTVLDVTGICCSSEAAIIEDALSGIESVKKVSVNILQRQVHILHHHSLDTKFLVGRLAEYGFGAAVVMQALRVSEPASGFEQFVQPPGRGGCIQRLRAVPLPPWNVSLGLVLWFISLGGLCKQTWYLEYVALGTVALCAPRIAYRGWLSMKHFHLDINVLMLTAAIGALIIQSFSEAGAVLVIFSTSDYFERRASSNARDAIAAIIELSPEVATRADTGTVVPVEHVDVGERVAVKPGDRVPIDGVVVSGASSIDESNLTGESRPILKKEGDSVRAGTVNAGGGFLKVETTALASDSAVAKLIHLVQQAQAQRSRTEKMVETVAKWYTPIVVFSAIVLATVPWAFGRDIGKALFQTSLVLLVVACPCALVISTPVTYVCAIAQAARRGILVKGGSHFEALARADVLCMDKTGTLTQGSFDVHGLRMLSEKLSMREMLSYVRAVEKQSAHPMAAALCQYADKIGSVAEVGEVDNFVTLPGEGVEGIIGGKRVCIGNSRMAAKFGWPADETAIPGEWIDIAATICWVGLDGECIGTLSVVDAPREEAREAIAGLRRLGLHTVMLTGDNQVAARGVQKVTDIQDIHSELMPEGKVEWIKRLKKTGSEYNGRSTPKSVVMVGDGVNDAPALAIADVGIAMGEGTVVAMETADMALMDNNLKKLVEAVRLGRLTRRKIFQNVIFSICAKVAVVVISLAVCPLLWLAIVSDVGAMVVVTLNSLTVMEKRKSPARTKHGYSAMEDPLLPDVVVDCGTQSPATKSCCDSEKCGSPELSVGAQGYDHDHGCGHGHNHVHGPGGARFEHVHETADRASCCGHGHSADGQGSGGVAGLPERTLCIRAQNHGCCAKGTCGNGRASADGTDEPLVADHVGATRVSSVSRCGYEENAGHSLGVAHSQGKEGCHGDGHAHSTHPDPGHCSTGCCGHGHGGSGHGHGRVADEQILPRARPEQTHGCCSKGKCKEVDADSSDDQLRAEHVVVVSDESGSCCGCDGGKSKSSTVETPATSTKGSVNEGVDPFVAEYLRLINESKGDCC